MLIAAPQLDSFAENFPAESRISLDTRLDRSLRFKPALTVRIFGRDRKLGGDRLTRCILYIMKRTQLYLDDDLWEALPARARTQQTTVSDLVRQAARERYLGKLDGRREAMQAFVGIRKDRVEVSNSAEHVRSLRRGSRIERLGKR